MYMQMQHKSGAALIWRDTPRINAAAAVDASASPMSAAPLQAWIQPILASTSTSASPGWHASPRPCPLLFINLHQGNVQYYINTARLGGADAGGQRARVCIGPEAVYSTLELAHAPAASFLAPHCIYARSIKQAGAQSQQMEGATTLARNDVNYCVHK